MKIFIFFVFLMHYTHAPLHAAKNNCPFHPADQLKLLNHDAWKIIGSPKKGNGTVVYMHITDDKKTIKIKTTNSFYVTNPILEDIYSIESFLSDHCYIHQERIIEYYELLVMIAAIAEIDIDSSKSKKSWNWLSSNWWTQYQSIENYIQELGEEDLNSYIVQQVKKTFPDCSAIQLIDDNYGIKFSKSDEMHAIKEILRDHDLNISILNNNKYW